MRLWLAIVLLLAVVDNCHSQDCLDDNGNMVSPGSTMIDDRCIPEICRNGDWELVVDHINPKCVHCRVYNDPHFDAFNGVQFDWHIGCNHVLVQEGVLQGTYSPTFGVFMDFVRLGGAIATVGPTTYLEDSITVELTPGSFYVLVDGHRNPIIPSTPTVLVKLDSTETTVKAWRNGNCIRLYGKHKILVELCSYQITIWAATGQDKLEGLCGSTDETTMAKKILVGRDGSEHNHPTPGWLKLCDSNFGFNWQTHRSQQSDKLNCPAKYNASLGGHGRRKRGAEDQIMDVMQFCGDVTNSPDREQCLNVVTEVDPEMFFNTCMFDLCVAVKFPEINITYDEMLKQVRQINVEAKEQADQTIDLAAANEAPTTPLPTSPTTTVPTEPPTTQLSTQDETQQPIPTPSPSEKPKCFTKKACTNLGGSCGEYKNKKDKKDCLGVLVKKGCPGRNCKCCIPELTQPPTSPATQPPFLKTTACPEGFFIPPGSPQQCFKIFDDSYRSWDQAKIKCNEEGLHMVHPYNIIPLRDYLAQRYGNNLEQKSILGYFGYWLDARGDGSHCTWQDNGVEIAVGNPLWRQYPTPWPESFPGCGSNRCVCMLTDEFNWSSFGATPYFNDDCLAELGTICELH